MKHLSLCALILFLIANIFFGYEPKTPYQILNEKGLESMYKLDQLLCGTGFQIYERGFRDAFRKLKGLKQ